MIAMTAQQQANDIIITYQGGPDASSVVGMTITKTGFATNAPYIFCEGTCPVGKSVMFTNAGPRSIDDNIIVTATFEDGATIVVLDTWV